MKFFDHDALYRDGRHYDLQHNRLTHDIDFYRSCARRFGAPVLELACGTGRLSLPIAQAGFAVTGMDVSEGMLAVARQKQTTEQPPLSWVVGDMRAFDLGERFNLVLLAFNSIAHLHQRDDVECCFSSVRRHLTETGRFVLAFFNPRLDFLTRPVDQTRELLRYADPDTGEEVIISESARYDAATQINYVNWHYQIGERSFAHALNMRMFFPQELDALFHYNGFEIEEKYGDFDRSAFISTSPHQIIVARARSTR